MTVRNNEERFGALPSEDAPIPAQAQPEPLNFVVPTMHVDLPSGGKYYAEGHPLHGEETVEIRFMTAKDEDILTSPNLIKKKIVLDRLIQSLILDKRIRSEDLIVGDKNAILIQARISGYGQWYTVKVTCPSCGEEQEKEFDLEEIVKIKESETDIEDLCELENGHFAVLLPTTKVLCELRLLRGKEEKILLKNIDRNSKNKDKEGNTLTQYLKTIIVSLNEDPDPKNIEYLADYMPVSDARYLRKVYDKISPDANLKAEFECEFCDCVEDMEVPLTVNFFWPE